MYRSIFLLCISNIQCTCLIPIIYCKQYTYQPLNKSREMMVLKMVAKDCVISICRNYSFLPINLFPNPKTHTVMKSLIVYIYKEGSITLQHKRENKSNENVSIPHRAFYLSTGLFVKVQVFAIQQNRQ